MTLISGSGSPDLDAPLRRQVEPIPRRDVECAVLRVEIPDDIHEVHEPGADGANSGMNGFERGTQFCDAEVGDCGGAEELDHGGRGLYRKGLS